MPAIRNSRRDLGIAGLRQHLSTLTMRVADTEPLRQIANRVFIPSERTSPSFYYATQARLLSNPRKTRQPAGELNGISAGFVRIDRRQGDARSSLEFASKTQHHRVSVVDE